MRRSSGRAQAIARVMPVDKLRDRLSHYEADECGAERPAAAPRAVAVQPRRGHDLADDFAVRPRPMADGETLARPINVVEVRTRAPRTGGRPASIGDPHDEDVLFCGDLFTQAGANPEPIRRAILGPSEAMRAKMDYFAHAKNTGDLIGRLARTKPARLAHARQLLARRRRAAPLSLGRTLTR